jgi:hypothetical protein
MRPGEKDFWTQLDKVNGRPAVLPEARTGNREVLIVADDSRSMARIDFNERHAGVVNAADTERTVTPWEAGQCQSNRPLVQVSPHVGGSQSTSSERGGSFTTKSAMQKRRVATAYFL